MKPKTETYPWNMPFKGLWTSLTLQKYFCDGLILKCRIIKNTLSLRLNFSLPPVAAKMMVYLDSSMQTKAAELAGALDESLNNRTIQVRIGIM